VKRKALSVLLVLALVIGSMTFNTGRVYAEVLIEGDWQYLVEGDGVTIIGYNGQETDIVIPQTLGGLPVKKIGDSAFFNCSWELRQAMRSVTIPQGVTSIGNSAFQACVGLTSIYIPDTVTDIGENAFADTNITSISLPEGLTVIKPYTFRGCSNLSSITIPGSVTSIEEAAFQMAGLTEVVIPYNVTYVGKDAFGWCNSLTSITFDNENTVIYDAETTIYPNAVIKGKSGSTAASYAAKYYRTFVATDPPSQPPLNFTYTIENGKVTITGYNGSDSVVNIPESIEGYPVTEIGANAFVGCSATTINLPSTLEIIGFDAFDYCRNLTSITIPSSVVTIEGYAFNACGSLTEVIILNPNAYIGDFAETFPEQAKIIGYDPSTAKDYAVKYGRTFEVYGGGQPSGGSTPPPSGSGTGDGSSVQIIGSVEASTITITAPLVVSFSIDPNNKERPLVTEDLVLTNNGNASVNVYVKSVASQDMQIIPSDSYTVDGWKRLSKFETERKLALLLGGKDLANANNLFLVTLKGKETKSLPVDVKHGLAFPMAKSCSIQVVLSYSLN
jgi:hypothetical protein